MIENDFDIPFIADLALREKQIQQNYRPVIAVHKWFARRPGTLFRGLLLSEFAHGNLSESFFESHSLRGTRIADPFMGGGTPLVEANRLGCDIVGYDINPMAYWIVRQELGHLDLTAYLEAASALVADLEARVGPSYRTQCTICGSPEAHVKYFIWVKTVVCDTCGRPLDLFPGYLLAENQRHPKNVLICPDCGELNEVENRRSPGSCRACSAGLRVDGPAKRGQCTCPQCENVTSYPQRHNGPPRHRMVAIEYYCPTCKPTHRGRFFRKPGHDDIAKYENAATDWTREAPAYVPEDEIPPGDETQRLLRWGYRSYRDMFNERQLLGLELSCRAIGNVSDESVRNALATNLSDLLRYQNMLCRYDTGALKSLDVFSIHGFPVGLIQCESNLLGIPARNGAGSVGSGGWSNIVQKYARAKAYCSSPFETQHRNGRKVQIPANGEWIGDWRRNSDSTVERRIVELKCGSSTQADLADASLDAVFTDPPYFANVQYAELMDFCYVWLRRLVTDGNGAFDKRSTRDERELTGNVQMERGLTHFTEGLSQVFRKMARALKPGAPLVFTYHHNTAEAYFPVAVAVLDAGLACTASIPCPGEMGASIHINGTGSSVVDTVFVCRMLDFVTPPDCDISSDCIAELVQEDLRSLEAGQVRLTGGDIRCVTFGHLIRLAIRSLQQHWEASTPAEEKLALVAASVDHLDSRSVVEQCLDFARSAGLLSRV